MEVKDLTYSTVKLEAGGKQRSLKALPRVSPAPVSAEESVKLDVSGSASSKANTALEQADALVTDLSDKANSINTYIKSLNGILEQGLKEGSEVRKEALAKEANQVLQAIRDKTASLRLHNASALSSDPLRSEVEAKLGRTLEILFPDDAKDGGSLPELSFSNKDLIISVQTKILRTSQYISELRAADLKKNTEVKDILDKAETAQINAESSKTSIRDVDSAFSLLEETTQAIGDDAKTALFAIGLGRGQVDLQG